MEFSTHLGLGDGRRRRCVQVPRSGALGSPRWSSASRKHHRVFHCRAAADAVSFSSLPPLSPSAVSLTFSPLSLARIDSPSPCCAAASGDERRLRNLQVDETRARARLQPRLAVYRHKPRHVPRPDSWPGDLINKCVIMIGSTLAGAQRLSPYVCARSSSIRSFNSHNMTLLVFTGCYREHLLLDRFPWQRSKPGTSPTCTHSSASRIIACMYMQGCAQVY